MRKGYKLKPARRAALSYQGFHGFEYEGHREDKWERENTADEVRNMGQGKPGLTVQHDDQPCTHGPTCGNEHHTAVYRDRKGTPVAYAAYHTMPWQSGRAKPRVSLLYADRTRGITHALAVGHIAHHLDKVGVTPSALLSHHSQTLISHGFEMKDQGRDAKIKQYLDRRQSRVAKSYTMSEERRQHLAQRYDGFRRRGAADEDGSDARDWHPIIRQHGIGKPGLSITHNHWDGGECERRGIGCDEDRGYGHTLVHRDHAGAPIAYAKTSADNFDEHGGKPYVSMMGSDRTRGVAHALAVGHIASHLDKMGVEPSNDMSRYSQGLVSHGLELKETGRDSKLKDYLARRSARLPTQQRLFDKGYKASPESASAARAHLGAGPAAVENVDEFAHDELSRIPRGKTGLSIHRNTFAWGGGWNAGRLEHESRAHTIVYRDHRGYPVTAATIYGKEHQWGKKDRRVTSTLVSDRSRGALHAIGTAHVANAVQRLHANETKEMTPESQRMVAHSLDRPERTAKLRDYIAARAQRVQKGHPLFHASTNPFIHIAYKNKDYGENRSFHAGTVRAALDRAKIHCGYASGGFVENDHEHYISRVKPRIKSISGSFKEPAKDEGSWWSSGSKVYKNNFEGEGSRSIIAATPQEAKVKPPVQIPHHLVTKHSNPACPPRCIHERALTQYLRAQS